MGWTSFAIKSGLFLALNCLLLTFLPGIQPDYDLKSFHIEKPSKEHIKLLTSNNILDDAKLIFEFQNGGVESIVELPDGSILGSDQTGAIYKISADGKGTLFANVKFPCEESPFGGGGGDNAVNCSWPLGMELDKQRKSLFFMDYFGGLIKLNLETKAYSALVPKSEMKGNTPEDLSISRDGFIYYTDGSTEIDYVTGYLGNPAGNLLRYDLKTKSSKVLLDGLHFSNGVCLSEDEDFVLVTEFCSSRITRYYLKGERKGQSDTFIKRLPGYPDNIRRNGEGGYYVAIFQPWDDKYTKGIHWFSEWPLTRKFILRLRHVTLEGIRFLKQFVQNVYLEELEKIAFEMRPILGSFETPRRAIIMEISGKGEIIGVFNGNSGRLPGLSQLTPGKKYGWMVGPLDNKIFRIEMETLKNARIK